MSATASRTSSRRRAIAAQRAQRGADDHQRVADLVRDHRGQPPERRQPLALRRLALERADRFGERVERAARAGARPRRPRRGSCTATRWVRSPVAATSRIAAVTADSGRVIVRATSVAEHRRQQQRRHQRAGQAGAHRVQEARAGRSASAGSAWWARRRPRRPVAGALRAAATPSCTPRRRSVDLGDAVALMSCASGRPRLGRQRRRQHAAVGGKGDFAAGHGLELRRPPVVEEESDRQPAERRPGVSPPSTIGALTTCSRPRGCGSSVSTSANASAACTAGGLVAS